MEEFYQFVLWFEAFFRPNRIVVLGWFWGDSRSFVPAPPALGQTASERVRLK
jgi:hypothetical protein